MSPRSRITLLTGGSTPERTVALAGAGQVLAALRRLGHEVTVVDTCSGVLSGEREEILQQVVGVAPPDLEELEELHAREDLVGLLELAAVQQADLLFLVLHGRQGEGGSIQSLLEMRSLRFTGSDSAGSLLAMDKDVAKRLLEQAGIATPKWCMWPAASEWLESSDYPAVVKPSRVGSTVGLTVVRSAAEVGPAAEEAMSFDSEVLVEEFLPGRELTVGVVGDQALGVGEIVCRGEIFDFHSKYTPGLATEIFPADIPVALEERLKEMALRVHRTLKLRDFSRVDFRLDRESQPSCLEANTLPGMTPTSLLPQSAAVAGLPFDDLCQRIVELALDR